MFKWHLSLNKAPKLKLECFGLNLIPLLIKETVKPSLNNSWISGFTDAEGCFSIVVGKNRKNEEIVKARFILDQKNGENALNTIAELFSPVSVSVRGYPVKIRKNSTSCSSCFFPQHSQPCSSPCHTVEGCECWEQAAHGASEAWGGGKVRAPSLSSAYQGDAATAVFRLSISTSDIKNPNSMLIKTYFNKFNLKTSKEKSFLI